MADTTNGYDRGEEMQIVNFLATVRDMRGQVDTVSAVLAHSGKLTGMGVNTVGGLLIFRAEIPARFAAGGWVQAVAASSGCEVRELD